MLYDLETRYYMILQHCATYMGQQTFFYDALSHPSLLDNNATKITKDETHKPSSRRRKS